MPDDPTMKAPHIVLAPDSYKGSATALDVAHALGEGLHTVLPNARLTLAPMADGGEGTLDCLAAARAGTTRHCAITAIHGDTVEARWFHGDDGLAVIESAEVLGLPLVEACTDAPPLSKRGSHALGTLIEAVLDAGVYELAIGLGGSACNDAGLGLLIALGAHATDRDGHAVAPSMNGLLALDQLDMSGIDPRLRDIRIRVLCDVDNPLLGAHGASRIYGPQKGLSEAEIDAVEAAFARIAQRSDAEELTARKGSGAAGGLGFALALLGAELQPGANTLMDMTDLRRALAEADLVITGEGRSDGQTLSGKLPLAIARAAAPTPTVLLSGAIAPDAREALEEAFAACHTLVERAGSVEAALAEPLRWVRSAAADIGRAAESLASAAR